MNNSKLAVEYSALLSVEEDHTLAFQERESDLIKIIAAIQGVSKSKEWSTLKETVFDTLTKNLTKDILDEGKKAIPDTLKLNRLAGQLEWAEKYSDLTKFENGYRLELTNVRIKLYGKS